MKQTVEDIPELSDTEIAERAAAWRTAANAYRRRYSYSAGNGQILHANAAKQAELDGIADYGERLLRQRSGDGRAPLAPPDSPRLPKAWRP